MSYKILLLEDETIQRQMVKEALETEGYEVIEATTGEKAIMLYRQTKPHLCLLDVMVPGKSGMDVVTQIRKADKQLPIIFVTARVHIDDLTEGFKRGGNDYIRKPYNIDEVVLRVKNWLAEKYGNGPVHFPEECRIGGVPFFPIKQQLGGGEGRIQLSYKETMLLFLLWQSTGNVVTREYLQEKIWGTQSIFNSRTLDVYITKLRKHFKGTANQILTLKGVGYRLISIEE